jgi:hypothetical protein
MLASLFHLPERKLLSLLYMSAVLIFLIRDDKQNPSHILRIAYSFFKVENSLDIILRVI